MSQLIKLNVTNRGQFPNPDLLNSGPIVYGFDVEDIVSPIRRNTGISRSYFVARTNKDGANNNLNGSKIGYLVTDALATIAAQSPKLLLLTVTSRRGVAIPNESYIFVSPKISENLVPVTGGGTRFFYIEDGDPLPVEYVVSQSVATIVAATTVGSIAIQDNGTNMPPEPKLNFVGFTVEDNAANQSTDVINVKEHTYSEMQTLIAANALPIGAKYLITDRGDAGIEVTAVANNMLALKADGFFLNPDFQDVGDYSGLSIPKGNNLGVWIDSSEASYDDGDIVFWNGIMYQITDKTQFAGTSPNNNSNAYSLLIKNVNNGYILECDVIHYNFTSDEIIYRADKRGNEVYTFTEDFQWGNNSCNNNKDMYDTFLCINQRGIFSQNISNSSGSITVLNSFTDGLSGCEFGPGAFVTVRDSGSISKCYIGPPVPIVFENGVTYTDCRLDWGYSNFPQTLDMTTDFSAGVLTIPVNYNYVGIFILSGGVGNVISQIVNAPTNHKFRFYSDNGESNDFDHTSIATAVANELVSDAAATNTMVGRGVFPVLNGSDFIEYEFDGAYNVRTNIVKLA